MCGIIGFTGRLEAQKILTEGLAALEYRGYDSAGIAYFKDTGKISIRKTVGKVKDLLAICDDDNNSTCGIGHTRWATHGGVTNANAHPHKVGNVALIHNGIIENYHEIVNKFDLADSLVSETDTEVVAALINKLYDGDLKATLKKAVKEITGSFVLVDLSSRISREPSIPCSVRYRYIASASLICSPCPCPPERTARVSGFSSR